MWDLNIVTKIKDFRKKSRDHINPKNNKIRPKYIHVIMNHNSQPNSPTKK